MTTLTFKVVVLAMLLGLACATSSSSSGTTQAQTTTAAMTTATTTIAGVSQCYSCTSCSDKGSVATCNAAGDTNKYGCYRSGITVLGVAMYTRSCKLVSECQALSSVNVEGGGSSLSSTCCYSELCNFSLSQMKSSGMTTLLIIAFASIAVLLRSM